MDILVGKVHALFLLSKECSDVVHPKLLMGIADNVQVKGEGVLWTLDASFIGAPATTETHGHARDRRLTSRGMFSVEANANDKKTASNRNSLTFTFRKQVEVSSSRAEKSANTSSGITACWQVRCMLRCCIRGSQIPRTEFFLQREYP